MPSTPAQRVRIDRVEKLIGLIAPGLNLVLAAGDRLSRIVGSPEPVYPLRPPGQAFELDRLARESRERLAAQRADRERLASGQSDEAVGAAIAEDALEDSGDAIAAGEEQAADGLDGAPPSDGPQVDGDDRVDEPAGLVDAPGASEDPLADRDGSAPA